MNVLVTGGAGFIGSHFAKLLINRYPDYRVVVLDALTYAGHISSLKEIWRHHRFQFYSGNIQDWVLIDRIIDTEKITHIVNFAAETHNDRSLLEPGRFIQTNTFGVFVLLEATQKHKLERMIHVSTDEVYGSIQDGAFTERSPLCPNTPYSASKAGGDLQVQSYFRAFKTPTILTRGSNTYGPYQYPEKLISFFTTRLIEEKKAPLYGKGEQTREWMHVLDHCDALDVVLHKGKNGEVYNIGTDELFQNYEVVNMIVKYLKCDPSLIEHIKDPRGSAHDMRYAMISDKLINLGWAPKRELKDYMPQTIQWYVDNQEWWKPLLDSQHYKDFFEKFYAGSWQKEVPQEHSYISNNK